MALGSISNNVELAKSHHEAAAAGFELRVAAFGGLSLRFTGEAVELASRKARALLAYLALAPDGTASREHLVGLLWSEAEEEKARASLRQVTKALRSAFSAIGFEGLTAGRNEITLKPSSIKSDVALVTEALAQSSVSSLLLESDRIADSLLSGYEDIDPSFRSWLLVQRENLAQRLIRGLEAVLDDEDAREDGSNRDAAEALVLLDPTHERACRDLIRRHAEAGDTAAALSVYNRLWQLLDYEYDVEPSEATQELIAAVKLGDVGPVVGGQIWAEHALSSRGGPAPGQAIDGGQLSLERLQLLVGHFDLDGIKPEQKHICIGFRSELVSTLVRFRAWSIIDISKSKPPTTTGPLAQPGYLLHGHLYQDLENVYLILELQDPSSGVLVWSERFFLKLDNYFAAQQQIVRKIAYSLNVHISQERLHRLAARPDISLDVFDRWLRGHAFVLKWKPDLRRRAAEIFKSIIADSPNFAPAYSSLVGLLNSNHFVFPGAHRTEEIQKEALKLAKKAVEIDPLDSRSQLHLAWSQAMNGEHGTAELGFKLACELNDNDPWTIASAAGGFAFCGQPGTGLELSKKGLELAIAPAPMVWAYVGCVRYINDDFDGCIEACSQSESEILVMLAWKVAALWRLGRETESAKEVRRLYERIREDWTGERDPTTETMIDWLVQCFPIRDREIVKEFRGNLEAPTDLPTRSAGASG